jgi:hypothetical protein
MPFFPFKQDVGGSMRASEDSINFIEIKNQKFVGEN